MSVEQKGGSRRIFVIRVRLIFGLVILVALLFVVRLYFLQVIHGEAYGDAGAQQYVATKAPTDERGDIFFRDKDGRLVTAATQQSGWRIAIQPQSLHDSEEVLRQLQGVVHEIDSTRFRESAARTDDPYEEVAFRLSDEEAAAVRDLDLVGVVLVPERWRTYPAGSRASHVLGFVGFHGHERVGRYGLERYWQDTLARSGTGLYVNFFAELFTNTKAIVSTDPAEQEGDVVTSIEPAVQQRLEATLVDISEEWNATQVGGIVMDPQTGAIIAMGTWPHFDPNEFNTVEDAALFSNPLVEGVYELGSIVKPLTVAAGLDAGVITPETTYYDQGFVIKSDEKISNYDGVGRGRVSMQEVLNQSLNTGVSFIVDQLGTKQFSNYMKNFGLGTETGIDLPNEVRGLVAALDSPAEVDYASASFGQGIAVTPIAMTRALSALANKGVLAEPHVVEAVKLDTGIEKEVWRPAEERVLSEDAAEEVTRMLVTVVDDALLKGEVKQERYSVAAKTGTAQIADVSGGGYYEDRFLHSFFGYFPAHDARYLIFLFAREPKEVRYASQTLTHPFMDLTKFIINYYDIPPDR